MTRRIDEASARQMQPWRERGMSRATWFRHRARAGEAGKTAEPGETGKPSEDETGKPALGETGETQNPGAHEAIKPPETGPCAGAAPLRLIESKRGPGRCAQCSDLRDGTEREFVINGARVLLHTECVRYYIKLHDQFHVSRWNRP
jgi:hypothetical protein